MAYELTWTIEGSKDLSQRLLIMSDKVKDYTPAFQDSAEYLKEIFSGDVFNTQGGAIDESWAPLSEDYAIRKAKKFPGKGILEATGTMRDSFLTSWAADRAEVWNTAEYFKYHQSNQPRSRLPRRVMMKLAMAQQQAVVKIFHTYFKQAVGI